MWAADLVAVTLVRLLGAQLTVRAPTLIRVSMRGQRQKRHLSIRGVREQHQGSRSPVLGNVPRAL